MYFTNQKILIGQNDLNTDTAPPKKNNEILKHKPEATLPEKKKKQDTLDIKK